MHFAKIITKRLLTSITCIYLSGCFLSEDLISGPQLIKVNDIEIMRTGGRLFPVSESGKVASDAEYFFRSTSANTIQIWSLDKEKNKWTDFAEVTSYTVPSGQYFIGRHKFGDNYAYFAYRFIRNDAYIQYISSNELKAISGLTWASLVDIFDDLTEGRSHIYRGKTYKPTIITYALEFTDPVKSDERVSSDSEDTARSSDSDMVERRDEGYTCDELGINRYINFADLGPGKRKRGYVCFLIRNTGSLQGVLTLKHVSDNGNWDLLIGKNFDRGRRVMHEAIDYKNNSGSIDELVWLPGDNEDRFVVVAYPKSDQPSRACLIYHNFDTSDIAGEAVFMATLHWGLTELLSPDSASQQDRNNTSRAIAGGLSAINRNNLALFGYDMVLNEVSTQLANTFGGGSWLFTFGVNYFGGYLEQSGKYLFDSKMLCGN